MNETAFDKAWEEYKKDFQAWQKIWNARHPHQAIIIDKHLTHLEQLRDDIVDDGDTSEDWKKG